MNDRIEATARAVSDAWTGYIGTEEHEGDDDVDRMAQAIGQLRSALVEKVGIIGRDRSLVEGVAKRILKDTHKLYEATRLYETRRGSYFEIRVTDPDGNWDGHVARVTVELDRVEKDQETNPVLN